MILKLGKRHYGCTFSHYIMASHYGFFRCIECRVVSFTHHLLLYRTSFRCIECRVVSFMHHLLLYRTYFLEPPFAV